MCGAQLSRGSCAAMAFSKAMSPQGLNEEWDQIPEVRKRVLAGNMFLKQPDQPWALPTRENAKLNKDVLIPCLHRLSATPDYHLPHLPALHVEIHMLHNKMGKEISPKYLYQCAIELKKFLSFIKRRATHKEVTKDCSFKRSPQKNVAYFGHD